VPGAPLMNGARIMSAVGVEWSSTPEIAARLGLRWTPQGDELRGLIAMLYALEHRGYVEIDPTHRANLWRKARK
jgi:hypothetical protein